MSALSLFATCSLAIAMVASAGVSECNTAKDDAVSECGSDVFTKDIAAKLKLVCDTGDCKTKLESMKDTCTGVTGLPAETTSFLNTYTALDPETMCTDCMRFMQESEPSKCGVNLCSSSCKEGTCTAVSKCSTLPDGLPAATKTAITAVKTASKLCSCPADDKDGVAAGAVPSSAPGAVAVIAGGFALAKYL
mmetsp:Transcript_67544/g.187275  ORF Transcript_67544/g.187275 Transcript_67544/m.187275 type:complete len:192 (-) Transcript_67544:121-696(-)|eukprot:CAMPEP_0179084524 /NCGR_PEP_ID=MMETSP0796-20121207/38230_1 /TAXON_ID=73915 /ORGANISM="Pyrodinium bahamense, Strain pbaha01" /LENGTH=191 /DNA_ID=CAMNT_0020781949 /DNA_START=58 /DNA_END=633 /DNA_ORIENTATION=+